VGGEGGVVDLGRALMAVYVSLYKRPGVLVLTDKAFVLYDKQSLKRLLPVVGDALRILDEKAAAEISRLEGKELVKALKEHGFKPRSLLLYSDVRRVEIEKGLMGSIKLKIATTKEDVEFRLGTFPGGPSRDEQRSRLVSKLRELGIPVTERA